ncbi:MAG: RelA/SpoT domain-containing protein [Opitutaceae bacterium]|nr:RelA/SpoT domain-containing protein [Opitutaceae bacterium]
MSYPYPIYSRNRVDKAGDVLVNNKEWNQYLLWDDLDEAIGIINNWRAAHAYPLNALTTRLKATAYEVSPQALIAQRLKRIEAIKFKMERSRESGRVFGLSTMQDIGGCRAVFPTVKHVEALRDFYCSAGERNRNRGSELTKMFDYIKEPKPDGYRGVHFVFRYRGQTRSSLRGKGSTAWDRSKFDGLKIEIQIRSILQHQWASAVETAGRYTRQNIKGSAGEAKWSRFFSLTGSAIAMLEDRPTIAKTPTTQAGLIGEIQKHGEQLELLRSYTSPNIIFPKGGKEGDVFVLVVDPERGQVEARPFQRRRLVAAQEAYFSTERTIRSQVGVEAVLVGVNSEEQLKIAYPSYYLDARDFVKTIMGFTARR